MGLIRATIEGVGSTFGDQNLEFITCPQVASDVLIARGTVNHGKGNNNASESVISNGSIITVPVGMAMMIVDNGEITEFSAEPGEYKYDSGTEASIFSGNLGTNIVKSIKTMGKRIAFGGQTAKDQRVYYVNLKPIAGNKFGSANPKKITDEKYGMLEITFFGEYVFKVTEPNTLVYSVIGSNPTKDMVRVSDVLGDQLKNKFVEKLTTAISIVMRKHKVSFGDISMYGSDISDEMNIVLDNDWKELYGLEICDVAIPDINLTESSMARVNKIDDAMIFSNQNMQSGLMANASADAMTSAASNPNGSMMGFMGMNMAQNTGGTMMGAVNQNATNSGFAQTAQPESGNLFGRANTSNEANNTPSSNKFCSNCGTQANGKFCSNCGKEIGEN